MAPLPSGLSTSTTGGNTHTTPPAGTGHNTPNSVPASTALSTITNDETPINHYPGYGGGVVEGGKARR